MAEPGGYVSLISTVRAEPTTVAQTLSFALPSGGNYLDATQVVPAGPTTFRITRRYMPQWAIISGIIGLFLCLIGLLAVFFRDTEELIVEVHPDPQGSRVTVAGTARPELVATIQSTLARFDGYSSVGGGPAPVSVGGITMSPDRQYWWDGNAWQGVAVAPPNVQRSPDGQFWWDGQAWRAITTSSNGGAGDLPAPTPSD